jgi:hypothetical protein
MALNNETFTNMNDLYKRVLPALNTRKYELERIKFNVNSLDIWDYCVSNLWRNKKDLRIYEMVSDILSVDELKLKIFLDNRNGETNERYRDN